MLRRGAVLAACIASAASLAACSADVLPGIGSDDSNTREGKQAKQVVQRFAQADGPEACEMMSPAALRQVYGKNDSGPSPEIYMPRPPISLAECRKRSAEFEGQEVDIEKVDLTDSGAARVDATTDGGDRSFLVVLRRRPGGPWLIDEIRER
jgi:hypothetical protein